MIKIDTSGLKQAKWAIKEIAIVQDVDAKSKIINLNGNKKCVEMTFDKGHAFLFELFRPDDDSIVVTRTFSSKGSQAPIHKHDVTEVLVCWEGSIEYNIEGNITHMGPSDVIRVPPGINHSLDFKEDSWFILIAIPATNLAAKLGNGMECLNGEKK